jgi:hypothetical protein
VIKIEIPYLWSFIRHYMHLGVNKIYLLSTNRSDHNEIHDYLVSMDRNILESRVTLIDEEIPSDKLDECINSIDIPEDYVLNVDIDEFLEIRQSNLHELLLTTPADYYNFRWLMVPDDSYLKGGESNTERGFIGHIGKYMARTAICEKFNLHSPTLTEKMVPIEAGRLIHYWGRSFRDVVFKCCCQRLGDEKSSSLQEVHEVRETDILPKRLKILALLCRKQRTVSLERAYLSIDYDFERKIERELQLELLLDDIYQRYLRYKSSLSDNVIDLYPNITLRKLANLL